MVDEIKFDKRNYRKHGDKNQKVINKSLKELGTGRSIVIDNDNQVICGNGVLEQSNKLKIPTKIIETDGKELIVIKRIDLAPEDKKRKDLALADNSSSDTSEFDFELLKEDFEMDELGDWGIDIEGWGEEEEEDLSNKNKEIDPNDLTDDSIFKLKYTQEEYSILLERLNKLRKNNESNESIVYKLIMKSDV